jgi:hypothetical protein
MTNQKFKRPKQLRGVYGLGCDFNFLGQASPLRISAHNTNTTSPKSQV